MQLTAPNECSNRRGLFAHRHMSLTVAVCLCPKFARIFTTFTRFKIKVMWLLSAFVDEIFGQIQITLFACRFIEFDQRQFDFRMTSVSTLLTLIGAEPSINMIRVTAQNIRQLAFARCLIVGDCALHEGSSAVQFMSISQM